MRILIVGAGVAGCIIARSLAGLRGVEVTCLERVARHDHAEAGTGLNIGPNAVRVLRTLDPHLAAAIDASSFPWRTWKVALTDGMPLFDLSLTSIAGTDGWRIRWSELYRILRDAAGSCIDYGCKITRIACDPAGRAVVEWTANGQPRRLDAIDLVIAADGRYSQARRIFSGEPAVRHIGVALSRVLVPDTSNGLIDDYEQIFHGPNRLLAFRVPPGHVYIACAIPIARDEEVPDRLKTADTLRAAFWPADGSPSPRARWLIDTACAHVDDTHWARMQEHDALYADPVAPVLYLGDAAHGMVPTLGQGATQAIEDAVISADVIWRESSAGRSSPRQWLRAIEQRRRARIDFAMQFSLEATDTMLAGADPVAGTLRKTEADFMGKLQRLYCDVPASLAYVVEAGAVSRDREIA